MERSDEWDMEIADAARVDGVKQAITDLSYEADSSLYFRFLTDKQRLYAIKYVEFNGNWKAAARVAGYSDNTSQDKIESGEGMYAYMTALKAELAVDAAISANTVKSRLNRLALRAERAGDVMAAIRATKLIGDMGGLFAQKTPSILIDRNGVVIQITPRKKESHDDALPADFREIFELNELPVPVEVDPA